MGSGTLGACIEATTPTDVAVVKAGPLLLAPVAFPSASADCNLRRIRLRKNGDLAHNKAL